MMRNQLSLFKLQKSAWIVLAAATVLAPSVHAEFVTNGGFENFSGGHLGAPSQVADTSGRNLTGPGYTTLTGWSNTGYTFLYAPGTADTTGSWSQQYNVGLYLWGSNNGGATNFPATSPDGGNFLASDPSYQTGAIQQTLFDLIVGNTYTVSFYYGAAQQTGFSGPTTEGWAVSFGNQTQYTPVLNDANHSFTGWYQDSMDFTATSTSAVLSFVAQGGPSSSEPPFALLDGVDVEATPEPGTWLLVITGMAGLGIFGRVRARRSS